MKIIGETHILSADDYYSYHGGLIKAVRTAKGSAPRAYVDSTDRSRVVMRSLSDEPRSLCKGKHKPEIHSSYDESWLQRCIGYVQCSIP